MSLREHVVEGAKQDLTVPGVLPDQRISDAAIAANTTLTLNSTLRMSVFQDDLYGTILYWTLGTWVNNEGWEEFEEAETS